MSRLSLQGLGRRYGSTAVVQGVDLDIAEGELVVLLGPSGCGKTTTLRMVAGFVEPSEGDVRLDGASIRGVPPHRRGMGIVFQSYALFPHLSVARNVAFGLEMQRIGRAERDERVLQMLRLARLEPLADRLPRQLSGGQQQRVALARALAVHPRVLLLDEPLSNLDASLRGEVGRDIRLMQREMGLTTIMVTHDQDEAMAMADRLVVMRDGRVLQSGTQESLYERPDSPFVAGFIGRSALLEGVRNGGVVEAGGARLQLAADYPGGGPCTLALRPERLALEPGPGLRGTVEGTVELASYLGAVQEHVVRIAADLRLVVRDGTAAGTRLRSPGESVTIRWPAKAERLFDATGAPVAYDTTSFLTNPNDVRTDHHG